MICIKGKEREKNFPMGQSLIVDKTTLRRFPRVAETGKYLERPQQFQLNPMRTYFAVSH